MLSGILGKAVVRSMQIFRTEKFFVNPDGSRDGMTTFLASATALAEVIASEEDAKQALRELLDSHIQAGDLTVPDDGTAFTDWRDAAISLLTGAIMEQLRGETVGSWEETERRRETALRDAQELGIH